MSHLNNPKRIHLTKIQMLKVRLIDEMNEAHERYAWADSHPSPAFHQGGTVNEYHSFGRLPYDGVDNYISFNHTTGETPRLTDIERKQYYYAGHPMYCKPILKTTE